MTDQHVRVEVKHLPDGRATVEIRLVAWSFRELRHLTGSLWNYPDSRKIGRSLSDKLDGIESSGRRRPMTVTSIHDRNDDTEKQGWAEVHGGDWAASHWYGTVGLANQDHRTIYHYFEEQVGDRVDAYSLIGFDVWIAERGQVRVRFLVWPDRGNKTIRQAREEGGLRVEAFTRWLDRDDGWDFLRAHFREMDIRMERYIVDQGTGPDAESEIVLGRSTGEALLITKTIDLEELER